MGSIPAAKARLRTQPRVKLNELRIYGIDISLILHAILKVHSGPKTGAGESRPEGSFTKIL